jgi:hypothetical protein
VGHTLSCFGTEVFVFGGGDCSTMFNDLAILDIGNLSKAAKQIQRVPAGIKVGKDIRCV